MATGGIIAETKMFIESIGLMFDTDFVEHEEGSLVVVEPVMP